MARRGGGLRDDRITQMLDDLDEQALGDSDGLEDLGFDQEDEDADQDVISVRELTFVNNELV